MCTTSDPICEKCVFVIRSLKLNRSGYHICHLSILFIIQIDRGESQVNTYVFEYYKWILLLYTNQTIYNLKNDGNHTFS